MALVESDREWVQQIIESTVKQTEHRQASAETRAKFLIYDRILFGDKNTEEKGMKEKVDEMYSILTQANGVTNFFGRLGGGLGFLILVITLMAWFGLHR